MAANTHLHLPFVLRRSLNYTQGHRVN